MDCVVNITVEYTLEVQADSQEKAEARVSELLKLKQNGKRFGMLKSIVKLSTIRSVALEIHSMRKQADPGKVKEFLND